MYRVAWLREGGLSRQSRLFRFRRNAASLYSKLVDDESDKYQPLVYARIEVLRAISPTWVVIDETVSA